MARQAKLTKKEGLIPFRYLRALRGLRGATDTFLSKLCIRITPAKKYGFKEEPDMFRHTQARIWIRNGWIASIATVLILTIPAGSSAVRPGRVSFTAEISTAQRAVAAMHPDEKLRNPDYLAEKFVSDQCWHYYHYSRDFKTSMKFIKTFRVGTYYYVNARTKHIDKLLLEAAGGGLEQVVVLGAGFDSRAYRFQQRMPKVKFYEMDLPAMIARKQATVQKIFGKSPGNVTFVAIDFNTQSIDGALKANGYNPKGKTFVIWEGVTYYITAQAVDNTLRFISSQSAPGSAVVFDYMPESAVKGDYKKYPAVRRTAFRVALAGEPLLSGLPEGGEAVNGFIRERGLEVISDVGAEELTRTYLIGSNGKPDGTPPGHFRIVHAKVP